ncbi:MAG: META domain-containing protein [Afipia felis]|nr:META domain-containing protein [Afipia felis]
MPLHKSIILAAFAALMLTVPARAQEFPFGLELTLDTPQLAGARRLPTLEIGENGEAKLDLWCKTGRGQFSVAGDTVIFMPGAIADNSCAPALAQADDALIANLGTAVNWKRQGDTVSFIGTTTLRFRVNSN